MEKAIASTMQRLTALVRILLGLVYLINGTNWFFKIITPYPSISDFVDYMPPPDIVGAMIEHGILFHLAKGMEVVGGIMLLANRMVPLALVFSMPVTVTVFIVDVFKPEFRLRAFLMGTGSLTMNVALLLAYFAHFRPMLAWRAEPGIGQGAIEATATDPVAGAAERVARPLLPILLLASGVIGSIIVVWLLVMVGQYIADPKAIHEVREMVPRHAARGA